MSQAAWDGLPSMRPDRDTHALLGQCRLASAGAVTMSDDAGNRAVAVYVDWAPMAGSAGPFW